MFKQRRITAHMAQLKVTPVNNASCSSDLTFRIVKKTGFISALNTANLHTKNLQRGSSPEILLREVSTWHRAGPHREPRLLKTLGTAWMCHWAAFPRLSSRILLPQSAVLQSVVDFRAQRKLNCLTEKSRQKLFSAFHAAQTQTPSPEAPTSSICLQGPPPGTNKLAKQSLLLKSS